MNRFLISLVAVAFMLLSTLEVLGARASDETTACDDGPAITTIKVLVENTESSSVYKYTVVNNHSHGISFLALGNDPFMGLLSNPENIPSDVRSPRKWRADLIQHQDRPYITFIWNTTDRAMAIKPGGKLNGFELEMNASNPNMSSFTFWAVDDASRCHWGKVEVKQ